jgi:Flp pilus assembly protein TadD
MQFEYSSAIFGKIQYAMNRIAFLCLFSLVIHMSAFAQQRGAKVVGAGTEAEKPWKRVLGVVVGVSKYQHISSLDFADRDAIQFYKLLVNPKSYGADSSMVSLLLNEQATWTKIWIELQKMQRRAEPGDLFFIYFAGHGDSYNAEDTYLLGHDAPPGDDPNNYLGNALPVYQLKTRIKELTQKGVKVVLITDACRSGELAGGTSGVNTFLEKVMEKNVGQLQITSCQSNQLSEEGPQWGGGRGVFSYFLIDALSGLADKDKDNIVTMAELQSYLIDSVAKATKSPNNPMPRQVPYVCCPDNPYAVISRPEPDYTRFYALNRNIDQTKPSSNSQLAVRKRKATSFKPAQQALIDSIRSCVEQKRFIEPNYSAIAYLKKLKASGLYEYDYYDIQDNVLAAMGDHIQNLINIYIEGKQYDKYKNLKQVDDEFAVAARMANEIKLLLGDKHFFSNEYEAKRLFLEARSVVHSENEIKLKAALIKCDEALLLEPGRAYVYNTKGLIYSELNQFDEAQKAFNKAIELAPNWAFVYNNLGMIYARQDKLEDAKKYFIKSISTDDRYPVAKNNLAYIYYRENEPLKTISLATTVLEKDSGDADALNFSGLAYEKLGEYDRAIRCYEMAMAADTTDITSINNYATMCFEKQNYKKAIHLLERYLAMDSAHVINRLLLAYAYAYEKQCARSTQVLRSLSTSKEPDIIYNFACVFAICDDINASLLSLEKAIEIGFADEDRIRKDNDLNMVRKDKRYADLMKRYFGK